MMEASSHQDTNRCSLGMIVLREARNAERTRVLRETADSRRRTQTGARGKVQAANCKAQTANGSQVKVDVKEEKPVGSSFVRPKREVEIEAEVMELVGSPLVMRGEQGRRS